MTKSPRPTSAARTLTRRVALAGTAAVLTAGSALAVAPAAQAASTIRVTSTCNSIALSAPGVPSTHRVVLFTDRGNTLSVLGRGSISQFAAAGSHTWLAIDIGTDTSAARINAARINAANAAATGSDTDVEGLLGSGRIIVRPCSATSEKRTVVGDANGDGRADVYALTTGGELRYYQTSASVHLMSGVAVGHGWGATDWIGRLTEQLEVPLGSDEPAVVSNRLIAHRTDGTVWLYTDAGRGKVANGVKIASGLTGYTDFAVTQTNSPQSFAGHALTAVKAGQRHAWDIEVSEDTGAFQLTAADDTEATTAVQTVFMPRLDADGWADQVDIDAAGTMRWTNYPNPAVTKPAVKQIGHGWGAMQIVASPGDMDGDGYSDIIARRADGNLYVYRATGAATWKAPLQIGANWNVIKVLG